MILSFVREEGARRAGEELKEIAGISVSTTLFNCLFNGNVDIFHPRTVSGAAEGSATVSVIY